jgi:hypothetical protein
MKLLKNTKFLSLLNSYLIDSPQLVNISYLWNFGSLLGICLVIQIITGTTLLTDVINIESIQSAPLFFIKINNTGKRVVDFINSFDFIKGIKYAAAFPVLPSSIANYHKSLFGRTLRVVGGLAAIITLTYNTDLAIIHTKNYIFYVIAFVGLSHMLYITFIFAIKSAYVLYYILTGKWIHRNSPAFVKNEYYYSGVDLKYFLTEGSAAFHCFTGICFVSGTWLGMAGTAITVDQLIGEDYFKEMAVFKQPALFLKSTFVTLDESIYFGNKGPNLESQQPTIKDNPNLNENGIRQNSDILNKLHQQEEFEKLKSKIASNPEIKQAFDKIKTELNVDIVKDIDGILKLVKK